MANDESRRITFATNRRSDSALNGIMNMTGENQTEAINRGLVLYEFLLRETAAREKGARTGEVIFYLTDPEDPDTTDKVIFA